MEQGGIMIIVKMSIIVGVVMLSLGFLIKGVNYALNKKKYMAFSESLMKILILIGGTIVIFQYSFDIYSWLAPPYPILLVIIPTLLWLFLLLFGKIAKLTTYLKEKSYGDILGHTALDMFETFLAIVSNVASFIRILALEMAHVGLMLVFSQIGLAISGSNPTIFRKIIVAIIIIFGNVFVILLETLIVTIHNLRLHFYEFFSKFYIADGYTFKPIDIENLFSNLQFATTSEIQTPFLYRRRR
jgi:V/A-type H+-transporting ATPase subunit I